MTPQRAEALEAELRRLAGERLNASNERRRGGKRVTEQQRFRDSCGYYFYTHAADLVRDAAKEGKWL